MRAAVLEQPGAPLRVVDDVDIIAPRVGEVRVRVRYCSLCHSDYSVVKGTFPVAEPIIVGHEAAGVVESVGPGVTHLRPGDAVVLNAIYPCGECYFCQRGEHSICAHATQALITHALPDGETGLSRQGRRVLRGVGVGALAEYVVAPAASAVKIDPDIPLDLACVTGCAVRTGVGAVLNTARVVEGATVLILGAGGVGLSTVQGARLAAASAIIVSDPVAERREAALRLGASHVVDPVREDPLAIAYGLTGGIGVDYAFETAGVAALIELGIAATRPGGTTVCVGAPPFDQSVTIQHAVLFASMEKKLMGSLLGGAHASYDILRLLAFWRAGRLDLASLITQRRPLAEINEAFADLGAGKGIRTVIEIG